MPATTTAEPDEPPVQARLVHGLEERTDRVVGAKKRKPVAHELDHAGGNERGGQQDACEQRESIAER
jgi:hypothetical protein